MIPLESLVKHFAKSVGKEKAEILIKDSIEKLKLEKKDFYSHEEVLQICNKIEEENTGFVKTIANELIEKFGLEKLISEIEPKEEVCKFLMERIIDKVSNLINLGFAVNLAREVKSIEVDDWGKVIKGASQQNLLIFIENFRSKLGPVINRFARDALAEASGIPLESLVKHFAKSVGKEKAEILIKDSIEKLKLEKKDFYSHEEVLQICNKIEEENTGFVRIMAANLKTMLEIKK
jgi:predicted transcriptional regulator